MDADTTEAVPVCQRDQSLELLRGAHQQTSVLRPMVVVRSTGGSAGSKGPVSVVLDAVDVEQSVVRGQRTDAIFDHPGLDRPFAGQDQRAVVVGLDQGSEKPVAENVLVGDAREAVREEDLLLAHEQAPEMVTLVLEPRHREHGVLFREVAVAVAALDARREATRLELPQHGRADDAGVEGLIPHQDGAAAPNRVQEVARERGDRNVGRVPLDRHHGSSCLMRELVHEDQAHRLEGGTLGQAGDLVQRAEEPVQVVLVGSEEPRADHPASEEFDLLVHDGAVTTVVVQRDDDAPPEQ